ncbi:minor capsid protein [Galactobacillus timonensis]|uniref:minor capsid protein n=1 Tax=Galactobacillus timonensis TaxID=2041840 RepID=UPI0023F1B30A|nr:minor capsid protein [Galactobacillus timonensis]
MSIHVVVKFRTSALAGNIHEATQKVRPQMKQQILDDCNANAPMKTGILRNSALRWVSMDNNFIKWDTPYAHFQYIGKVMIGEHSHSPWARRFEKKIYTNRDLTYRQGGARWIEKTKAERMGAWSKLLAELLAKEVNR